ncbi:Vegetative incompatibility protein HET-E-1 [Ceratobasidium sp. AG-Ba]|nr:Vegetative incompatibility protein HET-E-1 [Ceratobasidium sp. AG-Ba]
MLPYSPTARYRSAESDNLRRTGCAPRTRVELLQRLEDWAGDEDSPHVYWLNGMAGTGKTTVAYSFCESLKESGQLAASFFCARRLPECRDVNRILPSISYQLSLFSSPYRHALSKVLGCHPDIHHDSLTEQFDKLIAEPLQEVGHTLPKNLIAVIDALDECDNWNGASTMIDVLLSRSRNLPVKFFVTSRPEPRILDLMLDERYRNSRLELRLHEIDEITVHGDIWTYLSAELGRYMTLNAVNIDILTQRSGVLFIYAATLVRYIGYDNFSRAESRLQQILNAASYQASTSIRDIDMLYTTILKSAFDNAELDDLERREMTDVLGAIICIGEPLTVDALAGLLGYQNGKTVLNSLRPLLSVVQVTSETQLVTTLHESFPDFLLDQSRSGKYYCNASYYHQHLAQKCLYLFKVLNPPFNICNLQSSYLLDVEVIGLKTRIDAVVSAQLCFLTKRYLLWLEIMNLNQQVHEAARSLHTLRSWLLLTRILAHIASGSADGSIKIWDARTGRTTGEPLGGGIGSISAIAYSPNGEYIASGSRDNLVRIWSIRTGLIVGTIKCHSRWIRSVNFSPDGTYIASGSDDCTVCIWNADTAAKPSKRLKGHTGSVSTVICSPNSEYVVSGSSDKSIRVWSSRTGQMVGEPFRGHTDSVCSIAYSPDGAYLASGSQDCTVRVWNMTRRKELGEPLRGHTQPVIAVAYSPNGAYILSCSSDYTLCVWNVRSQKLVGQPLIGHQREIGSAVYSPDGAYIACSSKNVTIHIRETTTAHSFSQHEKYHEYSTSCITYSPDGVHVASGTQRHNIGIWDAQTGEAVRDPYRGHTDTINSIAYSPLASVLHLARAIVRFASGTPRRG